MILAQNNVGVSFLLMTCHSLNNTIAIANNWLAVFVSNYSWNYPIQYSPIYKFASTHIDHEFLNQSNFYDTECNKAHAGYYDYIPKRLQFVVFYMLHLH